MDNKFRKIMKLNDLTEDDIIRSMDIEDNLMSIFESGEGLG